jgi:TPR repeat protein
MTSTLRAAALSVVVVLSGSMVAAQDIYKGSAAYITGDYTTALKEFLPLADQGNVIAQYNLGNMYSDGQGVPKDDAEAVRWYRLAADQGYANAQYNLGVMYVNGTGLLKDDTEAVRWYRLAADQGNANAQYNLGVMHANGRGVPKDLTTAHMWWNIASLNGHEGAQGNRGKLEKEMTPEQIAEATRRAKVCMSSDYQDCD